LQWGQGMSSGSVIGVFRIEAYEPELETSAHIFNRAAAVVDTTLSVAGGHWSAQVYRNLRYFGSVINFHSKMR